MNTNFKTVPLRQFEKPMTWATDEQLHIMLAELAGELSQVHDSVIDAASRRNGYTDVEREIRWRAKTGVAKTVGRKNRRSKVSARAKANAPAGSEGLAFIGREASKKRMGAKAL